ncbi:hypothetical protein M9458_053732 [Cirrhinus mrigala]|uniref:Uncharacterized protein n=1 Tax=Cirrhinus mrigala TaxID=683832 RepID=A0ABD0MPR6_CIRMR
MVGAEGDLGIPMEDNPPGPPGYEGNAAGSGSGSVHIGGPHRPDKDARTTARHLLEHKKKTFGTKPRKDRTSNLCLPCVDNTEEVLQVRDLTNLSYVMYS